MCTNPVVELTLRRMSAGNTVPHVKSLERSLRELFEGETVRP